MKKKSNTSKSKVTQIKQKKSKLGKKKLGMGLSSLLSTDTALDSIIGKNTDDLDLGNSMQKVADKIKIVSNQNKNNPTVTNDLQQGKGSARGGNVLIERDDVVERRHRNRFTHRIKMSHPRTMTQHQMCRAGAAHQRQG